MRGTSRKWIALIAATCTLFVGLAVPSAYAEDATGQNATQNSATVDAQSNESADTSETAKPTQDQKTESENGDQGNTTQDKEQSGTAQDEKGAPTENSKSGTTASDEETKNQSAESSDQKVENDETNTKANENKKSEDQKSLDSKQKSNKNSESLLDKLNQAKEPATTSESGGSRAAANTRTLAMGRYFANLSSAGASAGYNITPGTYYVTGNGATGYIDINVCAYTPSTDGTSNCDYYNVGYYGGASMVVVDPNDRVEISSSNSGSKTNWQLRKKTSGTAYTPSNAVTRTPGNYFSDISSKSSYGVNPGLYLVTADFSSSWSSYPDISVCDYNVGTNETSSCVIYSFQENYNFASAEIQVKQNQRVEIDYVTTTWKTLKTTAAGTQYNPGQAFNRNVGTYYSGDTLPVGRFLLRGSDPSNSVDVEVCYYHAAGNEISSCRYYSVGADKGAAEIRIYPSQKITIECWSNRYATTYWNPLSAQSNTTKYQVKFDSRGGSKVNTQTVQRGKKATKPTNPTRTGYTFRTWTTDGAGKNVYNFNSAVYGNKTLYAQWTGRYYTIYFDAKGGTASAKSKRVQYGSPYGALPTTNRKGYTFKGWYTAQGNKVTSKTIVGMASNRTFHAVWVKK